MQQERLDTMDDMMLDKMEAMLAAGAPPAPEESTSTKVRKLTADEYIDLTRSWGYDLRRCVLDDRMWFSKDGSDYALLDDCDLGTLRTLYWDACIADRLCYKVQVFEDVLGVMASRSPWHPVREYLEGLSWDGEDRLSTLAACLATADGIDARRPLEAWMTGAVARVYENGLQNFVLVLDGPTGIGKSWFANWLCPLKQCFNESPIDPDRPDSQLRSIRSWVWEIPELDKVTAKADVAALKQFVTQQQVTVRKPYGKFDMVKPALASFIGTVNGTGGFLRDLTGNRRWWPVEVLSMDRSYKGLDVDQLWAQALQGYKDGRHLLNEQDCQGRQAAGMVALVEDAQVVALESLIERADNDTAFVASEDIRAHLYRVGAPSDPRKTAQWIRSKYQISSVFPRAGGKRVRGFYGLLLSRPVIDAG